MTDLGTLGGTNSAATSVGANGDVAGHSTLADRSQHINDSGLAIGEISPNPFALTRAAVWNTAGY